MNILKKIALTFLLLSGSTIFPWTTQQPSSHITAPVCPIIATFSKANSFSSLEKSYKTIQRIRGTIIGAAYGDALGRITEFLESHAALSARLSQYGFRSASDLTFTKYPQVRSQIIYTDDTVMAKIVAEKALEGRTAGWDDMRIVQEIAESFCGPMQNDPLYDARAHGNQNQKVLAQLCSQKGSPQWPVAAHSESIKRSGGGCGSVMRAWPIGLIFFDNLERVKKLAQLQSDITHQHPMAEASSVALAVGAALIVQGKNAQQVIEGMIAAAAEYDEKIKAFNNNPRLVSHAHKDFTQKATQEEMRTLIAENALLPSDMLRYAYAAGITLQDSQVILGKNNNKNIRSKSGALLGWAADETAAAAVYEFAKCTVLVDRDPTHIQEIVLHIFQDSAWTPGDSDSIAASAGALVGGFYGMNIPQAEERALVASLENYGELITLADKIASL